MSKTTAILRLFCGQCGSAKIKNKKCEKCGSSRIEKAKRRNEMITIQGARKLLDRFKEGKQLPLNWKKLIDGYIKRKRKRLKRLEEAKKIRDILVKLID